MATKAQLFHFINEKLRQSNLNDSFTDRASLILVYSVVMIALLVHSLSTKHPLSATLFFLVVSMNA